MRVVFNRIRQVFSTRLWAWPLLTGIMGIALAVVLTSIHIPQEATMQRYLFPGDVEAAASMTSFIASTTLTVLTTTISMTLIVLQVAAGSFSHQLLRDFISSRAVRGILAVYVGLFSYAIVVSRSLNSAVEHPPQLAMLAAMIGVFGALATFVWYVSRVIDMVRADSILASSADRVLRLAKPVANADSDYPKKDPVTRPEVPENARELCANQFGYVQSIDLAHAEDWARGSGATVLIDVRTGDPVMEGERLGWYWGADDQSELPDIVYITMERISGADFSLGLQQILDIAVRALSPGSNDPTTAIHAIGQGARVLRALAQNPIEPEARFSGDPDKGEGPNRLIVWAAPRGVDELLTVFVGGIRRYANGDLSVLTRLLALLNTLEAVGNDDLQHIIDGERERIIREAKKHTDEECDLEIVLDAARPPRNSRHQTRLHLEA